MKTFKITKKHFNIFLVVLLMIGSLSCFQTVQADETPPQTEVTVTFQQATLQFTQLPNFDFGRRNQFSSSDSEDRQQENQIKLIKDNKLTISSPDAKIPFNVSVKSMGTYVLGLKNDVWSDLSKSESTSLKSIWKSTQQNSGTLSLAPSSVSTHDLKTNKTIETTDNLNSPYLSLMYFPSSADNPQGGTSQDIWRTYNEGLQGTATISFPNKVSAKKITQIMVNNGSAYSNGGNNIEKTFLEGGYKEVVLVFPLAWNAAISADDQVAQE